jgi:LPLT family lysophospholipid transporter-like MFS transporter
MFVVPLNALLQERGHETVGAGHAVAVQNFSENIAMLVLVGLYTLIIGTGTSITQVAFGFGALILLGMLWLYVMRRSTTDPD